MSTQYMSLDLPTVAVTTGPTYAAMINTAFINVDAHDHGGNGGAPIALNNLSITGDISLNNTYSITSASGLGLSTQVAPLGITFVKYLYSYGGNLYYNNSSGASVRITNGANVDVTAAGAFTGLVAPAAATYSSITKLFSFLQDTNHAADLAFGKITFSDSATTIGNTISLKSPPVASVPSSFTLTLPIALPVSKKIMSVDGTGAIENNIDVDNVTTEFSGNNIQVKDNAITNAKIVDGTVGREKLNLVNLVSSSSCGTFSSTSVPPAYVTNLDATITTTGSYFKIELIPDASAVASIKSDSTYVIHFEINGSIYTSIIGGVTTVAANFNYAQPSCFSTVCFYSPNTFNVKVLVSRVLATFIDMNNIKLVVYEM